MTPTRSRVTMLTGHVDNIFKINRKLKKLKLKKIKKITRRHVTIIVYLSLIVLTIYIKENQINHNLQKLGPL